MVNFIEFYTFCILKFFLYFGYKKGHTGSKQFWQRSTTARTKLRKIRQLQLQQITSLINIAKLKSWLAYF